MHIFDAATAFAGVVERFFGCAFGTADPACLFTYGTHLVEGADPYENEGLREYPEHAIL